MVMHDVLTQCARMRPSGRGWHNVKHSHASVCSLPSELAVGCDTLTTGNSRLLHV